MADAQYVIDIAAEMGGAEKTEAELDALVSTLTGAGKGADFFSEAIARTANELSGAKAASQAAATVLADARSEFNALERSALQLARAADRTAQRLGADSDQAQRLAGEAAAAKSALDAKATALARLEREATDAADAERRLGVQLANTRRLASHADKAITGKAESLGKVQGALGAVGGPLGTLGNTILGPQKAFAEMSSVLGGAHARLILIAAGSAIAAAAILAITAVLVAGTIAVAKWSVGLADAARSEALAADAAYALDPALEGVRGTVEQLTGETGLAGSRLRDMAKQLTAAGVEAGALPGALRAAATAEIALGEGGSSKFVERLKEGKATAEELTAEFQTKLGPIADKRLRSIDSLTGKLKKNFTGLFSGLNIDPVLDVLERVADAFDETSAIGGTVKFLFETIFQPLIDGALRAYEVVEAFVLGALIGLTKLYIAAKPIIRAVSDFLGFGDDTLSESLGYAASAGELLAKAGVALLVVFATLAAPVLLAVGALAAFVAALGFALGGVVSFIAGAVDLFVEFGPKAVELGRNIVLGLAEGIKSAAGAVVSAITGAVSGAIGAAKKLLGIASPSKLFAEIGEFTGEGFVLGVEAQNDNARGAVEELVEPPAAATSAPSAMRLAGERLASAASVAGETVASAAAPASGGASSSVDLRGATFNFHGVKDGEAAIASLGEALTRILEGDAASLAAEEAA